MTAKAILVPKSNSYQFEDRVLELNSPIRIGRSHKDDKPDSGNGPHGLRQGSGMRDGGEGSRRVWLVREARRVRAIRLRRGCHAIPQPNARRPG